MNILKHKKWKTITQKEYEETQKCDLYKKYLGHNWHLCKIQRSWKQKLFLVEKIAIVCLHSHILQSNKRLQREEYL